jgi:hypothetical protein
MGVEMKPASKGRNAPSKETYANVAGLTFGWFAATADTTEPDWLRLILE